MAAQCEVCDKRRRVANNVSHSNIKTKSIQRPNLRRVHTKLANGTRSHIRWSPSTVLASNPAGTCAGLAR